jgi:hypothetical protein
VDEDLTFVEADVKSADDGVLAKAKLELFSFVHFVADIVLTLLDE